MGDLLPAFEMKKTNKQTEKSLCSCHTSGGQIQNMRSVSDPQIQLVSFVQRRSVWDSQFRGGTDRDVQSLSETLINTETRQEQPAVIPSCCSRQFYPPAEREGEKHDSQNLMKYARILIHRKAFWHAGTRNCRVQINFEQQAEQNLRAEWGVGGESKTKFTASYKMLSFSFIPQGDKKSYQWHL